MTKSTKTYKVHLSHPNYGAEKDILIGATSKTNALWRAYEMIFENGDHDRHYSVGEIRRA